MSGHSHYATIKRQKAASDAAKGNIFSKHARTIMLAARGGGDPDLNFKLRVAIDKARADNMPKENIERAIAKATTEASNLEEIMYEGFGPLGVSVIVEAATDNKNRTAQEVKNLFEKGGGRMAGPGAVSYNFESKGFLLVKKTNDPEPQMLKIIDAGAEDISEVEDGFEVYCKPEVLSDVRKKIIDLGFEIAETELQMKAKTLIEIKSPTDQEKVVKFLNSLEENDDVQKVYSNF